MQLAAMLVIFLSIFVLTLYFNPAMSTSLRWYMNICNGTALLSCIIRIASIRTDNSAMLNFSNWLMFLVNVVSLMKLALDLLYVLFRLMRSVFGTATVASAASVDIGAHSSGSLAFPLLVDDDIEMERVVNSAPTADVPILAASGGQMVKESENDGVDLVLDEDFFSTATMPSQAAETQHPTNAFSDPFDDDL